jgi:SNF2 family DNA or RNA helicase
MVIQNVVRAQWDMTERVKRGDTGNGRLTDLERGELLAAITMARLGLVHSACQTAGYGEPGQEFEVIKETVAELGMESTMKSEARRNKTKGSMKSKREALREEVKKDWRSSRMESLLKLVTVHLRTHVGKLLIFSEYLCALDTVEVALNINGIECLRYDATLPDEERNSKAGVFSRPDSPRVLLITNRSGGVGLEFIAADGVIHLTPCWNPHLTKQCSDRAIRKGQDKVVTVYHLYTHDSIERKIVAVQKEKTEKASRLLDPSAYGELKMSEVGKWTLDTFEGRVITMLRVFFSGLTDMQADGKSEVPRLATRKEDQSPGNGES